MYRHRNSRSDSGRGLLLVLSALAAGAVAVLLLADPFGSSPEGGQRGGGGPETGETLTAVADRPADAPAPSGATELRGVFGDGDRGAVRLRVVELRKVPIAAQPVRLVARSGEEATVLTTTDGVALFEKVAPGRGWRVEVAAPGFHPVTVQGVSVRARETTDLGDVVLGTNVVLRGRVVDLAGAAIPDASVEAFAPARNMATDGIVASMVSQATSFPAPADRATTDEDGWFTLAGLPEGAWILVARKAGHATKQESDVVLSQERPAKTLVLVLSPGATAKGKVTDEAGKAVAGARVLALRDAGNRWMPGQGLEREVGTAGSDGRYAIDTLMPGSSYRFGVLAAGYAPLFDAQGVEVEQVLERDFVLVRGGALAGVVKDRATGEPVPNATVTALTGRMPFGPGRGGRGGRGPGAAPAADEPPDRIAAGIATTDGEGRFRFEALLPGPVAMGQVKASGYVAAAASALFGGSWGEVAAGETLEVEVLLDRGGAVEGTLADAGSGAPIVGATVSLLPRENAFMVFATGAASGTTDATGKFRVDGVRPGKYGVLASASGYASPGLNDAASEVTVPEDGSVATTSIRLAAAGAVTGLVKDAKGEVVAGARVRVRGAPAQGRGGGRGGWMGGGGWRGFLPGAVTSDLTDQDGRFRIANLAAEERWILSAESDDHVPVDSEPFAVDTGEEKEVDLVVVGGGAIAGRVVDDHGRFVSGAQVRVGGLPSEQAMRPNLSAFEIDRYLDPKVHFTDGDGRFLATKVRPGRAIVRVQKEGFVTYYKRDVEVRSDETVENYVAALARGEVVEGIVKGEDGRPLEGATVAVTSRRNPGGDEEASSATADETVEPQMSSRTDRDGKFRIENVPPGRTYSVVVYFAPRHLGWFGGRSENAIRRDVSVPARDVEFRLAAAPEGTSPFPGGFGGRGAGGFGGRAGGGTVPVPVPVPAPPR